jgi:hypothetical protein
MNSALQNCTATEKELLSIVATLKGFRNILLGQQMTVFTDHKNLTCKNFNTGRVMRWRLVLEEFGPDLQCIKGERNDEQAIFNILLGQQMTVFTDHKNLACKNFNTERVMRWRLVLEEFGPDPQCIKGERDVVADALSRLEIDDEQEIFNISECFGYDDDDPPLAPSHCGMRTSPKRNYIIQHCY